MAVRFHGKEFERKLGCSGLQLGRNDAMEELDGDASIAAPRIRHNKQRATTYLVILHDADLEMDGWNENSNSRGFGKHRHSDASN